MSGEENAHGFPGWSDEELISLSEGWGYVPARTAVVMRHQKWVRACLARLARERGLGDEDVKDITQTAYLLIVAAISYFYQCPKEHTGPFEQHLRWFISRRGANEINHVRRVEGRYDRSGPSAEALELGHAPGPGHDCRNGRKDDPVERAQQRELEELLQHIHDELPEPQRTILDMTLMGATLSEIAATLNVCERTVRRWRDALFAKLRPILGKYLPGEDEGD